MIPLRIQTGHFVNCKEKGSICEVCNIEIKNEQHLICNCPLYNEEWNNKYSLNFNPLIASDKFISLIENEQNKVGKFSWNFYQIRGSKLCT